ncbi:MAG: thymidine phosphorylase [bacterium]
MSKYSVVEIINKKKNGLEYSLDEINWLINNISSIPDFQLSAWLMAVRLNGLSHRETAELTRAMAYSGHVLTLKRHDQGCDISGERQASTRGFVDKHSTGGVGDKVTVVLSPLLAALGFKVSKFSGGALGHTGGTVDKLLSIPGFKIDIDIQAFEKQIAEVGIAISGQTTDFAPADKKLYALRDLTSTVDSIPLIASSVMSKKIAGGADVILIDLKCGAGAFMKDLNSAKALRDEILSIACELKLDVKVLITNMNQPLGYAVGNSLEIMEAIEILEGTLKNDTYELVVELASLLVDRAEVISAIASGKAYVKFDEWISVQGGDLKAFKDTCRAKYEYAVKASEAAFIKDISCEQVGRLANELAFGLNKSKNSDIDYKAGVTFGAKVGDEVKAGDTIFTVFSSRAELDLNLVAAEFLKAITFSHTPVVKPKLLLNENNLFSYFLRK